MVFEVPAPRRRGRGLLALAVIAGLALLAGGFTVGMKIAAARLDTQAPSPGSPSASAAAGSLATVGQCRLATSVDGVARLGAVVPCEIAHNAEVIATLSADEPQFANMATHERTYCDSRAYEYLVDRWVLPAGSTIAWQSGVDRTGSPALACFVLTTVTVSGSVLQDAEGLDPDQLSFLWYVNEAESVRADLTDTSAGGLRAISLRMAGQLDATRAGLRNTSWAPKHRAAMDRLVKDLGAAAAAWQAVHDASTDADALAAGKTAMDAYGPAQLSPARIALGLPGKQGEWLRR